MQEDWVEDPVARITVREHLEAIIMAAIIRPERTRAIAHELAVWAGCYENSERGEQLTESLAHLRESYSPTGDDREVSFEKRMEEELESLFREF